LPFWGEMENWCKSALSLLRGPNGGQQKRVLQNPAVAVRLFGTKEQGIGLS